METNERRGCSAGKSRYAGSPAGCIFPDYLIGDHRMGIVKTFQNNDELMENILSSSEDYAVEKKLHEKDARRLRLMSEETVEMLKMMGNSMPGKYSIDGDEEGCVLRFVFDTSSADGVNGNAPAQSTKGVSGKIGYLLRCSYEKLGHPESIDDVIGVREAEAEDLAEIGAASDESAYIWSLDAYHFSSFDRFEEDDLENWVEISRSIIANLVDEVRILVFRDRKEASIHLSFKNARTKESAGISPDFEELKKVPVAKNIFQIKLIQLLYNRLHERQLSTEDVGIRQLTMPAPSAPKGSIPVLEYERRGLDPDEDAPCVLFLHGGAFLFPALPYHYRLAARIAAETGCRLFLPIYDLGPKNLPPLQVKETLNIYKHLISNSRSYRIDRKRIVVLGDSSGGTQAAAVSLLARDLGLQMPVGQVLLYPSVDERKNSESMSKYSDVPVINGDAIRVYQKMLKPDPTEAKNYYLSPVEAENLKGMPETYIETAEFDALHDEGVDFADLLKKAGNKVMLNETKGTVHAFDMAKNSPILAKAMEKRIAFIKHVIS